MRDKCKCKSNVIFSYIPKEPKDEQESVKIVIPDKYIDYSTGTVNLKDFVKEIYDSIDLNKELSIEFEYDEVMNGR